MKTLLMRFISHLVLISYCTSILRLDYGFASETITTTQTLPPPRHLVLKLRPRSTDFEVKVKRIAEFSSSGEVQEPGLKIKLKARAEASVLTSSSPSKRQTLKSVFIPDRVPLSEEEMRAYGLRAQLDEQSQNVIGFVWKLNDFPDMDLLIVRDGSILATGSTDRNSTVKFTSPYKVHLKDFTAPSVALKAQNMEFSGQVSLSHVSLIAGHLINKALWRNLGHQSLSLGSGTLFENHAVMASNVYTSLFGAGRFINRGTLISPTLTGKIGAFENKKDIKALEIDVEAQESLTNDGVIEAKKTTLKSKEASLYNQGEITGSQSYHLEAATTIQNGGTIKGNAGIMSASKQIINKGDIRNATLKTRDLQNTQTGVLANTSLEVEQGENLGVIEGKTLTIKDGRFINKNSVAIHSLLGSGEFHNAGNLAFTGSLSDRSLIGVKSFLSQADREEGVSILGKAVTVLREVDQFILKEGTVHLEDLLIEGSNPAALYQNWTNLIVENLTLNQAQFDNHGDIHVKGKLTGNVTLINRKKLSVEGEASLREGTLLNQGEVTFKERAEIGTVHNQMNFTALKGLTVDSFINSGQAIIKQLFVLNNLNGRFENTGRLDLIETMIRVYDQTIYNKGTLFLQAASLLFFEGENHNNRTLDIYNEGTLALQGGGQFGTIKNVGRVEFNSGKYFFRQWINNGNVYLFGDRWTVEGETSNKGNNLIKIRRLENNGRITAENKVIHGYGDLTPKGWEAKTFVFKLANQTLTPANLAGINAPRIEVEATNFEVKEASTILIPHLLLTLTGHFHVDKDLSAQTLEVYARGDFHCGTSNANMARLVTQGPLTVHAAEVDARFAKIFGKGNTALLSRQKDILVGEVREVKADTVAGRRVYPFDKKVANGAFVASEGELTLHAYLANIYNKSEIFSKGLLTLKARRDIGLVHSQYGKILSLEDIIIEGKKFAIAQRFPVHLFPPREPGQPYLSHIVCLEETPLLQSLASIRFKTQDVINQGADIYASQSIYHQDQVVAKQGTFKPTSLFSTTSMPQQYYVYFYNKFGREDYYINDYPDVVARVVAGQVVDLTTGAVNLTGMTSGFKVNFKSTTFTAQRVGSVPGVTVAEAPVVLSLADFARQIYGSTGFIKVLADGTVTTDIPMSGGLRPSINQQLYITDAATVTPTFNPNPGQAFLVEPVCLQFIVQQALAEHGGTLNINGRSGEALIQYLLDNAAEIIRDRGSALITRELFNQIPKSLLAFQMTPAHKARPLLRLVPTDINRYQSSADISSQTTATIHTTESQRHIGNRVVGTTGVTATSEGTLEATSTVATNVTYEGNKRVTTESIEHQQLFSSPQGSVTVSGDQGVSLTASHITAATDVMIESKEGNIEEKTIVLKKTEEESSSKRSGATRKKKTETRTKTSHTFAPTKVVAGRTVTRMVGSRTKKAKIEGTQTVAGQDILHKGEGEHEVLGVVAHDTVTTTSSKRGVTSSQWKYEHISSPVFLQALHAAGRNVHFDNNKRATLAGTVVQGEKLINGTKGGMTVKPVVGLHHQIVETKQRTGASGVKVSVDSGQEVACPTVLAVRELHTEGSALELVSVDWDKDKTKVVGMYREAIQHLDSWHRVKVSKTGVPPKVMAVAGVAYTVMTGGTDVRSLLSSLKNLTAAGGLNTAALGQVAGATFNVLCETAKMKLIASGGDIDGTLKSLVSKEGLKSLAVSLAVEGVMGHFNVTAPEGYADLTDIATYAAKKAAIGSAVNVVAGQQKLKEAIKGAGVNFAVAVIGRYGAQEIGRAYGGINEQGKVDPTKTKIGFVEHKLLHAGLGAIVGGIQGDPLAGAIGGAVAETVADTFKESEQVIIARVNEKAAAQGIAPGSEAYDNLVKAEVKSLMDWSKIAAVTVAALADRDINISLDVATNALEYNFMEMISAHVRANALEESEAEAEAEEEEELSEGTVTTISAEAPEEAAPAEQPRSRKGKEKARDENDYEDVEPSAPSSITEADYFHYGDDTEEFHEMMWNLTAGEKLLSNPIKESSALTSKGPVREDEEPRGRSRERTVPGKRSHSKDAYLQSATGGIKLLDQDIEKCEKTIKDKDSTVLQKVGAALKSYASSQIQADYNLSYQLNHFGLYASDAVSDLSKGKVPDSATVKGMMKSGPTVVMNVAPSIALASRGTKPPSGVGSRNINLGGRKNNSVASSSTSSSKATIKRSSVKTPADVAASYNARQRNECMKVVFGQKTSAANQNRQSIGAMYLQRQQKAANSNLLRMQKTGTGGSSSTSGSSFVSVGVGSTITAKTIKTGGPGSGGSRVKGKSTHPSNPNSEPMGTTLDGRREAKGKQVVGKIVKADKGPTLKKPHGNSLDYVGETHVYSIHRVSDGKAMKAGESTQGVRKKDGASKRAEAQARKLQRETGELHITKIRKKYDNKKDAKDYESNLIKRARDIHGEDVLPLNKNGH